jgi:hypothetical protein
MEMKTMLDTATIQPELERRYVGLMMGVVGRALVSASQVDAVIHKETSAFPTGFILQMKVMPNGPAFTAQVTPDGALTLLKNFEGKPDLCARFKHVAHAFLVLSFQEGTARAFANDRLYVDGDVGHAIRLVRCLSRMEVLILPKLVAERAVKRYPNISVAQKLSLAARIYGRVAANFLKGA